MPQINQSENQAPKPESKTNNILSTKEYSALLSDIKNLIETGINQPNQDATSQSTNTYWKIGERIEQESLSNKSGYHNSILKDLSIELEIERSLLSRYQSFYKAYKSPPHNKNLSWSHYKLLITIKDKALRKSLELQAQKEDWTKEKLSYAIKQAQNPNLTKDNLKLPRPIEISYLYRATILEVIDGDTLLLSIDLGFQVNKEQRIRLLGLNAPEKTTKAGKKSYQFLLNKAATLDQILIQTKKIDIYGRYLAHIFYQPTPTNKFNNNEVFKNGIHLNEEIIRLGFAEVM